MRKLTTNEIQEIVSLYSKEGLSISKLKVKFRLQFEDIKQVLIDNGITPRSHRESRKTYNYDENYFNQIDTPDKAYWLGFIYADGFVTDKANGSPVFGITLAEREPLEKLNKAMNSNKPIGEYTKKNGYKVGSSEFKLAFCSPQLVSDLKKWGCSCNKTFILKYPSFLPDNLKFHFLRGYFDGDGSIFYTLVKKDKKEYLQLGITICGTESFLEELVQQYSLPDTVYKDKRKTTDCCSIKLNSNKRCLDLYHLMYKNCGEWYLSRKKEKFDNFIKERSSTTTISNPIYGTPDYISQCYIEG